MPGSIGYESYVTRRPWTHPWTQEERERCRNNFKFSDYVGDTYLGDRLSGEKPPLLPPATLEEHEPILINVARMASAPSKIPIKLGDGESEAIVGTSLAILEKAQSVAKRNYESEPLEIFLTWARKYVPLALSGLYVTGNMNDTGEINTSEPVRNVLREWSSNRQLARVIADWTFGIV